MLPSSIDIAKLTQPKLGNIYSRERLNNLLRQASDSPIIWISAPPGSGKTTLVTDYLNTFKLDSLWMQVDEDDADAPSFFHYLRLGVSKLAPNHKQKLPALTAEYNRGLKTFSRNFFREIFDRFPKQAVLVLDNFQSVGSSSPMHELLATGFGEIPHEQQVIVVSREGPPGEYSRLLVNKQIEVINSQQLELTEIEQQGIASLQSINKGEYSACNWMAGFILMLEQGPEGNDLNPNEISGEGDFQSLFNYFTNEVFAKTETKVQEFLAKTAYLPMISVKNAEDLTLNSDAEQILSDLQARNFFIQFHSGNPPRYQYHPMFRSFLLNRAKQLLLSTELTAVRWNAASILENDGQIEDAAEIMLDLKEWRKLSSLIEKHAPTMIDEGRHQTLQQWLVKIPEDVFLQHPWLLFWRAESIVTSDPKLALNLFRNAITQFDQNNNGEGVLTCWSRGMEALRMDYTVDVRPMRPWVDELEKWRTKYSVAITNVIEGRIAFAMLNAIWWEYGDHPEALYWRDRCYQYSLFLDENNAFLAKTWVLFFDTYRANFDSAYRIINELKMTLEVSQVAPNSIISFYIASIVFWLRRGNYSEVCNVVGQAESLAVDSGAHVHDVFIHSFGIIGYAATQDMQTVQHHVEKLLQQSSGRSGCEGVYCQQTIAWLYFVKKDYQNAKVHIDLAMEIAETGCTRYFKSMALAARAYIYHALGLDDSVIKDAKESLELANMIQASIASQYPRILLTYLTLEEDPEEGLEQLKDLLTELGDGNQAGFMWWSEEIMLKVFSVALQYDIEKAFVQKVISTRQFFPKPPPYEVSDWPWGLKICCLGKFSLEKDGEIMKFGRKVPKKPLELLKALIALGGTDVREIVLVDALWPDAEADTAQYSLNSAIHRLRQIIGAGAISLNEGCVSLEKSRCWVDIYAFEDLLERNRLVEGEEARSLLEEALVYYRGHFLATDEYSWSARERERLRIKSIQVVNRLSEFWIAEQKWQQAISTYQKGLEIDNLTEEIYQGLIRCYYAQGLNAEAADTYHQCKKALSLSLGIKPSSKTEMLYQNTLR